MTLLIDAAPLVVLADTAEPLREDIPITAEIDYLLGRRFGNAARRAFLTDLADGRFTVAALERSDYATVIDIDARYADLHLGLADCVRLPADA